jgi:hypothetical protein
MKVVYRPIGIVQPFVAELDERGRGSAAWLEEPGQLD